MKSTSDSSLKKVLEFKKYKDLYDFSSIECKMSIFAVVILDSISIASSILINKDDVLRDSIALLDNIGIAMIGFLGFIVTGLAILTGAISSKIVKRLQIRNKIDSLERILLSFYLLGMISASIIFLAFIFHYLERMPKQSNLVLNIIFMSVLTYLIVFSIFYAVKLIGNCLELFYIVNSMEIIDDDSIAIKTKYNNYRITALEKILFSNSNIETVEAYGNTIKELIETDEISLEERQLYLEKYKQHFGKV